MLVLLIRGFMICAIEMGSGVMIYIPGFIKVGSGIQKSMGGYTYMRAHAHTYTHRQTVIS
jgi:hypothetical protein